MYEELVKDAYDLHVHTGPDVLPRKLDDFEMAERLQRLGMKGYGIKSHYFCTAERAALVNRKFPEFQAIGAICLNNTVGGLNAIAVEMAARDGAKIVWMPTFDAANEQEHLANSNPTKLPHWAKLRQEFEAKGKALPTIRILDQDNRLKKEVYDCLEVMVKYNLILATGHLGKQEIYELVKEARDVGVRKIVITHPNFPSIALSKEEQKELAEMGAIMEHCFTTPASGKVTWESVFTEIRYVGPEHCILSTDLGQPNNVYPDEGLLEFVCQLIEHGGFTRDEVRRMTAVNTANLVEEVVSKV